MKLTYPQKAKGLVGRRVAPRCFHPKHEEGFIKDSVAGIYIRMDLTVRSFAATSWQNQLFRRVCRDLKIGECEEISALRLQATAIRGLRRKLVSDRFD